VTSSLGHPVKKPHCLCAKGSHHYTHTTASAATILSQRRTNLLNNPSEVTLKLTFHSFFHSLTHSFEQGASGEFNRLSASQEIPRILRNPTVQVHIYNCPSTVPILRQINPVHGFQCNFLWIHLNIRLPFMSGSSKSSNQHPPL
jgi:hypothetical protein